MAPPTQEEGTPVASIRPAPRELSEAIKLHVCLVSQGGRLLRLPARRARLVAEPRPDNARFSSSRWFTREWTLQELVAPKRIEVFTSNLEEIGTKSSLATTISANTWIPLDILHDGNPSTYGIADRMSWAAGMETTRKEDVACSLLGLFCVNMPLLYGEGGKAFIRLQEELLRQTEDYSVFTWTSQNPYHLVMYSGFLAPYLASLKNRPSPPR